ncbi:MAG TPA: DUF1700 domain-containing protein [Candidatus Saccharimonadales bacterium]|nr:DUF1700 domain-containing protein [Candidatus Saccharimonadales bacterium]
MSVKQKFLDQLRANLRTYPSGAVDDYIDYYDELIAERVASGETEAAVVEQIGSAKDAAHSFKRHNAIERAVKKPTVSNWLKALIALLSVLSLPLLIPVFAVMVALLVTAAALFACGLAVLVLGVVAAILSTIEMASIVIAGDAPLYLLLLTAGVAVVAIVVALLLLRGLILISRWFTRAAVRKMKSRHNKRNQNDQHLSTEKQ